MSRNELKMRLVLRLSDSELRSTVTAANDELVALALEPLDVSSWHEASSAEALLERAHGAFGDIGFEIADRIRAGFTNGLPRRALVYVIVSEVRRARALKRHVAGVWSPLSTAELLAVDGGSFAAALYRSFLWRDPSPQEKAAVEARLCAGVDRRDEIASVARLPAARATPVPVAGVVDVDSILRIPDDGDFVDRVYVTILGRLPDSNGACHWRGAARRGVPRDEIVRRFARDAAAHHPDRVYIGLSHRTSSIVPPL
jgi:hypothetical protein